VAYACNPRYSRGRDQEDCDSKPSPAKIIHKTLSQKTLPQKIGLVEWLKVKVLSSSPSTTKKKNYNIICSRLFLTDGNVTLIIQ
jgi:hypothetical protein